ncbi:MAG: hypothetical protein ACKVRO_09450 [Micropepsaceae bacterium]
MSSDDLRDARAKLAWANREIEFLAHDLAAFFERKPYAIVGERQPDGRKHLIFNVTEEVPGIIQASVGSVLYAQRSSLDILANCLANRNGHQDSRDTYFPIAKTATAVATDKDFRKKIRKLADSDKAKIIGLKPYQGGNDRLYALHHLNLMDKHRRLLEISGTINQFGLSGFGHVREIRTHFGPEPMKNGAHILTVDTDDQINLNFTLNVSFSDSGGLPSKPIVEMLNDFTSVCDAIINMFA